MIAEQHAQHYVYRHASGKHQHQHQQPARRHAALTSRYGCDVAACTAIAGTRAHVTSIALALHGCARGLRRGYTEVRECSSLRLFVAGVHMAAQVHELSAARGGAHPISKHHSSLLYCPAVQLEYRKHWLSVPESECWYCMTVPGHGMPLFHNFVLITTTVIWGGEAVGLLKKYMELHFFENVSKPGTPTNRKACMLELSVLADGGGVT